MRCTSKGSRLWGRNAFTTPGPMVRLGTKCPSITSTWIQSAPAAETACTSSPRRAKSAAKIDGDMRTGCFIANLLILGCLPAWSHPRKRPEKLSHQVFFPSRATKIRRGRRARRGGGQGAQIARRCYRVGQPHRLGQARDLLTPYRPAVTATPEPSSASIRASPSSGWSEQSAIDQHAAGEKIDRIWQAAGPAPPSATKHPSGPLV